MLQQSRLFHVYLLVTHVVEKKFDNLSRHYAANTVHKKKEKKERKKRKLYHVAGINGVDPTFVSF